MTLDDPSCWNINLRGGTTTWAIITAITNVNDQKPIVSASSASCDSASDSVFPSVYGEENDVLLLSQSFDDTASVSDFKPPDGTSLLGWARSEDEVSFVRWYSDSLPRLKHSTDRPAYQNSSKAGFLFGERLDHAGQTGKRITGGPGGSKCKDALLSVVVNRAK